ncbi:MAG: hypothetical protein KDB53_13990, partial [Planctomycetes bacterium]|nr:hypothetical protein [Planctomycetota bacterium]
MRPRKPVTTLIRVRIVTIALCGVLLTALAPAQGDDSALDPKTAAAVAATTKVLEEAQTKLGLANLALQDRYAALATAWVRVRDGQDEAFVADLTRVLADPIQEARRAGPRRAERSFAKALPKALKKAEHDLLVTLEPVMEKVGLETFAQVLSQLEDLTAQDFAETLKASVFPEGRDLYVVWNESLAETVEEAQAFVAAEAARQKIADEIMVLRDPRSAYSLGA